MVGNRTKSDKENRILGSVVNYTSNFSYHYKLFQITPNNQTKRYINKPPPQLYQEQYK